MRLAAEYGPRPGTEIRRVHVSTAIFRISVVAGISIGMLSREETLVVTLRTFLKVSPVVNGANDSGGKSCTE